MRTIITKKDLEYMGKLYTPPCGGGHNKYRMEIKPTYDKGDKFLKWSKIIYWIGFAIVVTLLIISIVR